jgi:hypothetical protein
VAALVHNDLQAGVTTRRPEVGELCSRLREAGALEAAMTGSGSAVFGIFTDPETAARARAAVAPARAWVAGDLQPAGGRKAAGGGGRGSGTSPSSGGTSGKAAGATAAGGGPAAKKPHRPPGDGPGKGAPGGASGRRRPYGAGGGR